MGGCGWDTVGVGRKNPGERDGVGRGCLREVGMGLSFKVGGFPMVENA